jgi:hypothetical protein
MLAHHRTVCGLLAKTRFHGNSLASLGPPPRQHGPAAFRLHAAAKPVRLRSPPSIGLERPFRHEMSSS